MMVPFGNATRKFINTMLAPMGLRVVNRDWGPLGFAKAFQRLAGRGFRPKRIVDIGAAKGEWTRECATVFPEADYLLVEPREENRSYLDALKSSHPKVSTWYGALGSTRSELGLRIHGEQSSFLAGEFTDDADTRRVSVMSLDDLLSSVSFGFPDIIKIDVQGYELEVLGGASKALEQASVLLIETSIRRNYSGGALFHEVIAACKPFGFRVLDFCTYAVRPADSELMQTDVLLCKSDQQLIGCELYIPK